MAQAIKIMHFVTDLKHFVLNSTNFLYEHNLLKKKKAMF